MTRTTLVAAFKGETLEIRSPAGAEGRYLRCPVCKRTFGSFTCWPNRIGVADGPVTRTAGQSMLVHFGCADDLEAALDQWAADGWSPYMLGVGQVQITRRKI